MQTFALIGLVCLWATQVSAAAQPAITARAALPSDFIGMGTFDSTSANAYGSYSCDSGLVFTSSGNFWNCGGKREDNAFATSCGGKGAGSLYYSSSVTVGCQKNEKCHTNILYDNKNKKHAVTEFGCRDATSTTAAVWTLYRADPPILGKDGKAGASGRFANDYGMLAAVAGGTLALAMAVLL